MSKKPWMAIISFPHPDGTRPHVLMDDELQEPAKFKSPAAIEKVMMNHMLGAGVWHAFNFENGQLECLG